MGEAEASFDALQLRVLPTLESDLHVGLGLTTRKNAEFCLLGRRGNAHRNAKDVREIILSPVREHSRKPDEAIAPDRALLRRPISRIVRALGSARDGPHGATKPTSSQRRPHDLR
jgi:hypothetical protein